MSQWRKKSADFLNDVRLDIVQATAKVEVKHNSTKCRYWGAQAFDAAKISVVSTDVWCLIAIRRNNLILGQRSAVLKALHQSSASQWASRHLSTILLQLQCTLPRICEPTQVRLLDHHWLLLNHHWSIPRKRSLSLHWFAAISSKLLAIIRMTSSFMTIQKFKNNQFLSFWRLFDDVSYPINFLWES